MNKTRTIIFWASWLLCSLVGNPGIFTKATTAKTKPWAQQLNEYRHNHKHFDAACGGVAAILTLIVGYNLRFKTKSKPEAQPDQIRIECQDERGKDLPQLTPIQIQTEIIVQEREPGHAGPSNIKTGSKLVWEGEPGGASQPTYIPDIPIAPETPHHPPITP